jgi:hypothetical protein
MKDGRRRRGRESGRERKGGQACKGARKGGEEGEIELAEVGM